MIALLGRLGLDWSWRWRLLDWLLRGRLNPWVPCFPASRASRNGCVALECSPRWHPPTGAARLLNPQRPPEPPHPHRQHPERRCLPQLWLHRPSGQPPPWPRQFLSLLRVHLLPSSRLHRLHRLLPRRRSRRPLFLQCRSRRGNRNLLLNHPLDPYPSSRPRRPMKSAL